MLLWPRSGRAICLKLVEKRCKRGSARHCLRSFGRRTCNTFGIFWHSHFFHWLVLNLDSQEMLWAQLIEQPCFQEVDRCGEFKASLARVIIKIYGIRTMFYLMLIMALQIVVSQVYSVYLVQKALSLLAEFGFVCSTGCHFNGLMNWCDQKFQFFNPIRLPLELTHIQETWGYFQWVQNYWQEHGILPDLREPLFMAMAVFSALPMSNILLSSINNHVPKLLFRFRVLATLITFHSHEYNT